MVHEEFEKLLEAEWMGELSEAGRTRMAALCAAHPELAERLARERRVEGLLARRGPSRAPQGLAALVLQQLSESGEVQLTREQLQRRARESNGGLKPSQPRGALWTRFFTIPSLGWAAGVSVLAIVGIEANILMKHAKGPSETGRSSFELARTLPGDERSRSLQDGAGESRDKETENAKNKASAAATPAGRASASPMIKPFAPSAAPTEAAKKPVGELLKQDPTKLEQDGGTKAVTSDAPVAAGQSAERRTPEAIKALTTPAAAAASGGTAVMGTQPTESGQSALSAGKSAEGVVIGGGEPYRFNAGGMPATPAGLNTNRAAGAPGGGATGGAAPGLGADRFDIAGAANKREGNDSVERIVTPGANVAGAAAAAATATAPASGVTASGGIIDMLATPTPAVALPGRAGALDINSDGKPDAAIGNKVAAGTISGTESNRMASNDPVILDTAGRGTGGRGGRGRLAGGQPGAGGIPPAAAPTVREVPSPVTTSVVEVAMNMEVDLLRKKTLSAANAIAQGQAANSSARDEALQFGGGVSRDTGAGGGGGGRRASGGTGTALGGFATPGFAGRSGASTDGRAQAAGRAGRGGARGARGGGGGGRGANLADAGAVGAPTSNSMPQGATRELNGPRASGGTGGRGASAGTGLGTGARGAGVQNNLAENSTVMSLSEITNAVQRVGGRVTSRTELTGRPGVWDIQCELSPAQFQTFHTWLVSQGLAQPLAADDKLRALAADADAASSATRGGDVTRGGGARVAQKVDLKLTVLTDPGDRGN